jgi:hypothetical protein
MAKGKREKGNGSSGDVYDRGPHEIPSVAPPLPVFLTDDEEKLPTNRIRALKNNRERAGVTKHKTNVGPPKPKKDKVTKKSKAVVPVEFAGRTLKVPVEVGKVNGNVRVIGKRDPSTIEREELIETLERNNGYITYAALELGTTFHHIKKMVEGDKEIKELVENLRETDLDVGEDSLMNMVKGSGRDKLGSTIFLLKCRAKSRGYVENEVKKVEAGNVQINLISYSEEDVKGEIVIGETAEDLPAVPGT